MGSQPSYLGHFSMHSSDESSRLVEEAWPLLETLTVTCGHDTGQIIAYVSVSSTKPPRLVPRVGILRDLVL